MEHDNNTVRHMPALAARRAAALDRLRQLTQENELAYSRLEQERAARVQAEKDLAGVKALLRETNQQLAKQRRTLTWQFGEAVTRARTLKDYVLLPYRLIKLSEDHRRQSRHAPVVRKHASAALPAETASAIKEALEYVKRVRSPEVILWIGRQPWPAEVRAKVFCEVAKWARTSYPQIAEQIVQQLLGLDPPRRTCASSHSASMTPASSTRRPSCCAPPAPPGPPSARPSACAPSASNMRKASWPNPSNPPRAATTPSISTRRAPSSSSRPSPSCKAATPPATRCTASR